MSHNSTSDQSYRFRTALRVARSILVPFLVVYALAVGGTTTAFVLLSADPMGILFPKGLVVTGLWFSSYYGVAPSVLVTGYILYRERE